MAPAPADAPIRMRADAEAETECTAVVRIDVAVAGAHHLAVDEMHVEAGRGHALPFVAHVPVPHFLSGMDEALDRAMLPEQTLHLLGRHVVLHPREIVPPERVELVDHDALRADRIHPAGLAVGLGRVLERARAIRVVPHAGRLTPLGQQFGLVGEGVAGRQACTSAQQQHDCQRRKRSRPHFPSPGVTAVARAVRCRTSQGDRRSRFHVPSASSTNTMRS